MGLWSVVIPHTAAVTNLVTNPSVETATTGYAATAAGSLARVNTNGFQRRGAYSLQVTPDAGAGEGAYFGTFAIGNGYYTASFDFYNPEGHNYRCSIKTAAAATVTADSTFTALGYWQRVKIQWIESGGASTRRIYIQKASGDTNTDEYYIDGLMVTAQSGAYIDFDYFDGDTPGCAWTNTAHASTSKSDPQARSVGYAVDLSDYGLYIDRIEGTGLPTAMHNVQYLANTPGGKYRGGKVKPRSFLLSGSMNGSTRAGLHTNRKAIVNLIKRSRTKDDQPYKLRTTQANDNRPLDISVVTDVEVGTLDAEFSTWQDWVLRLIGYDPYFYELGNEGSALTGSGDITWRYFAAKVDGAWAGSLTPSAVTDPGTGIVVNAVIQKSYAPKYAASGNIIYVCGNFLNWDGDADADYIAQYNPDSGWADMGAGTNGQVICMTLGPDGNLYVGGNFTNICGTAANYVGVWNGSTWSALSTGLDSYVVDLKFGPDGTLYAAGAFTDQISAWNGSTWAVVGGGMDAGTGRCLAIAPNGDVYLGGTGFSAISGNIAKYNGSAWSALGTGTNGQVEAIAFGPDGTLYAGGSFTTADGNAVAKLAQWNGSRWSAMGSGVSGGGGNVYEISVDYKGRVYIGGDFTIAGGINLTASLAVWNGYSFVHPDIYLPGHGTSIVYAISLYKDNIYLGFNGTGGQPASNVDMITNSGSAESYPTITVNRSGGTSARVLQLWNLTTDKRIYLDYSLLDGETLTLDCEDGSVSSSFFGNVSKAVIRGSDLGEFYLLPGSNSILSFIYGAGTPTITYNATWPLKHESLDGVAA